MTWPYALLVGVAATASMMAYWIMIRAVLPWIGLRQAAAISLGSSAVAGTLPAGGAVAVGVSWAMLSSWGLSTADYVLYTLVTGIWNLFTLMGLPVLAVLVMATATRPDASVIGSLPGFRDRVSVLLAARGWRITTATVASHLTLWLVLLACLRAVSLSQARLPWQTSLAAFSVIRLLTAIPITPGGLGITELGLIGILAGGAGHKVSAQVTTAVLMYRAVTYLPSIPLGALACLTWRYAPRLISASPRRLPGRLASRCFAGPAHHLPQRRHRRPARVASELPDMTGAFLGSLIPGSHDQQAESSCSAFARVNAG